LAAVSLGLARGALDEFIELAQTKAPTFSMVPLADKPAAQIELARAEAQLAAARALVFANVDELWAATRAGQAMTSRQRALSRAGANPAVGAAAAVPQPPARLAGASAIMLSSPFQRHMRDAEALAHHFGIAPHVWEDAGRVLLGRPATAPMF